MNADCLPCQQRQARLNSILPGLGDLVKIGIDGMIRVLGTLVDWARSIYGAIHTK